MMKNLLFLLALFAPMAARAQLYGLYQTCELQTAMGQAVPGAQVYFLTQPANTSTLTPLATVYSNSAGTGGPVTQPLITNGFGECSAYLAQGVYTVVYISQYTGQLNYVDQNVVIGGQTPTGALLTSPSASQGPTQPAGTNFSVTTSGGGKELYNGNEVLTTVTGCTITECLTPSVQLSPIGSQTIAQSPGTALTVNVACIQNQQPNANGCFGAVGDLTTISGCAISATSSSLACSGASFVAGDVGKTMYVAGAGTAGATLISSIATRVNSTTVTLNNAAATAVTSATAAYGTDNTTALQNAINFAIAHGEGLYIPAGNYLHHGLNITGFFGKIVGDGFGSATLVAAAVTNPGKINSAQTTGVDISGSIFNEIDGIFFQGGIVGFADLGPNVNVYGGRTSPSGNGFAIAHVFSSDIFRTSGPYNVVLYGYEQTDFLNCEFQQIGTTNSGQLVLSAANSYNLQSPYETIVASPTSMTKVTVHGARTVFAASNGFLIVLDEGNSNGVYTVALRDFYAVMNGVSQVFMTDTGGNANYLRDIVLDTAYIEGPNCTDCSITEINSAAWQWSIRNTQFYANTGQTVSTYNFYHGFLGGNMSTDSTGTTAQQLSTPSCAGSVLQLGEQFPLASCTDFAYLGSVSGGTFGPLQTNESPTSSSTLSNYSIPITVNVGGTPTVMYLRLSSTP
jgi:hypothetical protein